MMGVSWCSLLAERSHGANPYSLPIDISLAIGSDEIHHIFREIGHLNVEDASWGCDPMKLAKHGHLLVAKDML